MIQSRSDLVTFVQADLARFDVVSLRSGATAAMRQPQIRFQLRMRVAEWLHNTRRGPLWKVLDVVSRWRLQRAGIRLGYTIPVNSFGKGLKLPHWGTIVIGGEATIGDNCTCHPNVLVGTRDGSPTIGDNVYLGNGAQLYGPITIGNNSTIAPSAVVTKDVDEGVTVAGVPARVMG